MAVPLVVVPALGPGFSLVLGLGPDIVEVTGGRTRTIIGRVRVWTQGRNYSMTTGRRKSTSQTLRVKAKKSLGSAPWGRNDDKTNMAQGEEERPQGQGGAESSDYNVETRADRCSVNLF